ncbi:MAG: uracil phosphoribosyltransferase [Cyanobacteriota bacterium]|nr:uracil phosphoribosyltransferase [Cyanobacteriota bacterium]
MQLKIYVPPHPLIKHWLAIARDVQTPMPLFRSAMQELGRWLTYEAMREWIPTLPLQVQTPLTTAEAEIINPEVPVAIVPILRAGLAMLEGCVALLPQARVYHIGMKRDEETLHSSCYLNRLPPSLPAHTRILIPEPMLATGGTLSQVLEDLAGRGADLSLLRVVTTLAAPPALQKLGSLYPMVQIYAAMIDETLNEQGFIVPGLGDAGDRAFGTEG